MNTLKRYIKNQDDLFCDDEDDLNVEDLQYCISFLNITKNRFFEESQYQSKTKSVSTFI